MKKKPTEYMNRVGAAWLVLLLIAVLMLFGQQPGTAAPLAQEQTPFKTMTLPDGAFTWSADAPGDLATAKNPKLDSTMAHLAANAQNSRRSALDLAASQALRLSGDRVQAQIVTTASSLDSALQAVAEVGGEVTGIGSSGSLIQGWLPMVALEELAADDAVLQIRRPPQLVLLEDTLAADATTEGLAVINGPVWHSAGYRGAGVKIGIIDGGFQGYPALLGTDLPASVTVRNFVDGESDALVNGTTKHGAACAEIIHDIAPDASIYLAKIDTNLDMQEAVAWLQETHHVDIISTSLGWYNMAPGDGTGELANLVQAARNAGILWVTAAGNERETHWGGLYNDPAGSSLHHFTDSQTVNFFGPGNGQPFAIPAGYPLIVFMRWNDWVNVNQDYDLYLLRWNGSGWTVIASGQDTQNGGGGQKPVEFAAAMTSGDATAYGFGIKRYNSNRNVNFEVYAPNVPHLDQTLAARSLANLGDSPGAVTVAALDVSAPYPQEPYSSQGPTNGPGGAESGGATKPDIAGFANVSTASYGTEEKFNGTSSATPHVAGAAALVMSAYPAYTPDQVQAFLEGRAVDMGAAGKDTVFGSGRLYLGSPPAEQFAVTGVIPNTAPNIGSIAITVNGAAFQPGAQVKLSKSGQPDINATSLNVLGATQIIGNLDLTGAASGTWNVVVSNPDAQTATLVNGFTVSAPSSSQVYLPLTQSGASGPPPTVTVTPTPTSSATPTPTHTPTATPTNTPTTTPVVAPVDGTWTGANDQGFPLSFLVSSGGVWIDPFTIEVGFGGACGGVSSIISSFFNIQISSNSFSATSLANSISGQFTSRTSAQGNYTVVLYNPITGCRVERRGTWNASFSGAPPTITPTVTATPTPTGEPQPNPLQNPDFEQGAAAGWSEYSAQGWPVITNDLPPTLTAHSGTWLAWLGGDDDELAYVEQTVTVPAAAPELSYWVWIASEESGCNYDFGGVIVNGSQVVDTFGLCAANDTAGWVQRTVSLAAYAGQNIALQIRVETDSSVNSNLFLDDVAFVSVAQSVQTTPPQAPISPGQLFTPGKAEMMQPANPLPLSPGQRFWIVPVK